MNPFYPTSLPLMDVYPVHVDEPRIDIMKKVQENYPDEYKKYSKYMVLDTTITCKQLLGMGKSLEEVVNEGYMLLEKRIKENFYNPD